MLYSSYYLPSISYSFPMGILTKSKAEDIQGSIIQILLNGMGYNHNTPRLIVFGPTEFGGIGLSHLFSEHGSIKMMSIIQQIYQDQPLGHFPQIQLVEALSASR